jgi:tetratricopeptide (TPR) repeat protein
LNYFEKALEIRLAKLGQDHPDVANVYHNIATLYETQGKFSNALEFYEKAVHIRLLVFKDEQHKDVVRTYNHIAIVYKNLQDEPKAIEYFDKARKRKREEEKEQDK